jgi:hypothetical protein
MAPPPLGEAHCPGALARDQRLGCPVDLVLAPQPLGTPLGESCARRAQAVAVLQHPVLPPILDMGLHDGRVVLVCRHAVGRLLAAIPVREVESWGLRRVLQLGVDLAAALGLAHAQGLCHGSVSAQSVLVERDGLFTLLDLAWPRTGRAVPRGTLAPEVQRGQAPTPRADVYALGQVLRHLTNVLGAGRDGAVQDVVRRATALAPQERYADGAALAQALGSVVSAEPAVQASVSAAPRRAARPAPRVVAAPVAFRTPARSTQSSLRSALLPLAVSLAIGLLPVAGAVAHDVLGHPPLIGFHGGGWPGWDQPAPWPHWRHDWDNRSWAPQGWGTDPDGASPRGWWGTAPSGSSP